MLSKSLQRFVMTTNVVFATIVIVAALFVLLIPVKFYITCEGILEPKDYASVKATVSGTIDRIDTHEGQEVQAHQPLIHLGGPEVRIENEEAAAEYKEAAFLYWNGKVLHDKGLLSQKEFFSREKMYQIARYKKAKLEDFTIRSPISGMVLGNSQLDIRRGDYVQKGDLLFRVAKPGNFVVKALVGEDKVYRIRVGQDVTVQLKGVPHYYGFNRGKVLEVLPESEMIDKVKTFQVFVSMDRQIGPNNLGADIKIYPTMGATVKITYQQSTFLDYMRKEAIGL